MQNNLYDRHQDLSDEEHRVFLDAGAAQDTQMLEKKNFSLNKQTFSS